MAETLNECIQEMRLLIQQARRTPVDGLYLDEAGDIQDRLLRADAACVEILARIRHEILDGVVDNPRPPARFNGVHRRPGDEIPERRDLPERRLPERMPERSDRPERQNGPEGVLERPLGVMHPHLGHATQAGENPGPTTEGGR